MNNERGSIIFAFLLALVITVLGVAILTRAFVDNTLTYRATNSSKAFWVAEAGIQRAVWEYKSNSCRGLFSSAGTACTSCSNCGTGNKILAASLSNSAGDYDITLNAANTLVTAVGSYPSRTHVKKLQRTVRYVIGLVNPFSYAMFSSGNIVINNNATVDSYDSNVGLYGSSGNVKSNGDVGTNGGTIDVLTVGNNATIMGDASTGPGGTIDVGNGGSITGTQTHSNNISLPAVTVPSTLTSLSSGGTLSVANNNTSTLTAGNYKFSNIDMRNNAVLNITGSVNLYLTGANALSTMNGVSINITAGATLKVYVDGVLDVKNNATLNNVSKLPSSLQIYSTYTGSNGVILGNNGDMYGAIYAPNTGLTVNNNGSYYGSVVGGVVTLANNGEVHYDEQLANLNNPYASTVFSSWQEL